MDWYGNTVRSVFVVVVVVLVEMIDVAGKIVVHP